MCGGGVSNNSRKGCDKAEFFNEENICLFHTWSLVLVLQLVT